jgi:hypothetical protein
MFTGIATLGATAANNTTSEQFASKISSEEGVKLLQKGTYRIAYNTHTNNKDFNQAHLPS